MKILTVIFLAFSLGVFAFADEGEPRTSASFIDQQEAEELDESQRNSRNYCYAYTRCRNGRYASCQARGYATRCQWRSGVGVRCDAWNALGVRSTVTLRCAR